MVSMKASFLLVASMVTMALSTTAVDVQHENPGLATAGRNLRGLHLTEYTHDDDHYSVSSDSSSSDWSDSSDSSESTTTTHHSSGSYSSDSSDDHSSTIIISSSSSSDDSLDYDSVYVDGDSSHGKH